MDMCVRGIEFGYVYTFCIQIVEMSGQFYVFVLLCFVWLFYCLFVFVCLFAVDHKNQTHIARNYKQPVRRQHLPILSNGIGGVMVRGFELRSVQTKDYKISICCFLAKHVAILRKSKDWLARNHNNVSEWGDMFSRELLFE